MDVYETAMIISEETAIPLGIRAVVSQGRLTLEGDLQQAVILAMSAGTMRYFARSQLYGFPVYLCDHPNNIQFFWLFADWTAPGNTMFKPIGYMARTDPPNRLGSAEMARFLLQDALAEYMELNGEDPSSWGLDSWLCWQRQTVENGATQFAIRNIQHKQSEEEFDKESGIQPPGTTGFIIHYNDGSMLCLTGEGPTVWDGGTLYLREPAKSGEEPTYRAITVDHELYGHA